MLLYTVFCSFLLLFLINFYRFEYPDPELPVPVLFCKKSPSLPNHVPVPVDSNSRIYGGNDAWTRCSNCFIKFIEPKRLRLCNCVGSSLLYRKFVHPALVRREQHIDAMIEEAQTRGYQACVQLGGRGIR